MRLRIFVLFLALFVGTTAGHIYTIDSYLNYLVTKSIGGYGTLEIPKFMMTVEGARDGRYYSKLGPGQSLVSLPLFWLGSLIESRSPGNPAFRAYSREFTIPHESGTVKAQAQTLIRAGDEEGARLFFTTLTNAFVVAAMCLLFWMLLKDFGLSDGGALWGTLLLALCTPFWVYSRDFFSEPLFALCLVGSFYLLKDGLTDETGRKAALAGLLSSVGILARASFVPIAGIFAVYLFWASDRRAAGGRQALKYVIYCIPGIAALAVMNTIRFGSPFTTGYHTAFDKGFSVPLLRGLAWNLASPYRSIFLYAPATLLFFLGMVAFAERYRRQLWLIVAIVVYVFVIYSKWWAWHGGWCWGPRFLVPVIPLLVLPGLVVIPGKGRWLLATTIVLGALGFVVQLSGVLINFTAAYDYWIKIGKLDWAEVDIHLFSPVATHLKAVFATDPQHYDLWVIQMCRVNRTACCAVLAGLAGVIGFVVSPFLSRFR
jgi:hypothetical protein